MKKGSLFTAFLVVLVDLLGFGIVLPLLPFYAQTFDASAVVVGLLYSVYSFAQLIFSPIWGSYSDRVGRRPIMMLSTFGAVIAYIIFGFAGSLWVLFLSRILAGVMGGNISTAQAYIADVTTEADRAKGMGLIGAAFGIGFAVGPALASLLLHDSLAATISGMGWTELAAFIKTNKYSLPGFFAAALSLISFLLVVFKLPEPQKQGIDKAKEVDNSGEESTANKRHSIFTRAFWQQIAFQREKGAGAMLLPLLIGMFVLAFSQSNLYSAFPLFSKQELGLSADQVGVQFFFIGIIAVIVQGGLIRYITKYYREESIFTTGMALMLLGMLLIPFATTKFGLSIFLIIMALGASLTLPTMQSLISKEAGEDNVGAIMGTSQGLSGLGRMLGPTWGGFWFGIYYGLPFFITAGVLLVNVWIGWKLLNHSKKNSHS